MNDVSRYLFWHASKGLVSCVDCVCFIHRKSVSLCGINEITKDAGVVIKNNQKNIVRTIALTFACSVCATIARSASRVVINRLPIKLYLIMVLLIPAFNITAYNCLTIKPCTSLKPGWESIFKVFLPKNSGLFNGESIFLYNR